MGSGQGGISTGLWNSPLPTPFTSDRWMDVGEGEGTEAMFRTGGVCQVKAANLETLCVLCDFNYKTIQKIQDDENSKKEQRCPGTGE